MGNVAITSLEQWENALDPEPRQKQAKSVVNAFFYFCLTEFPELQFIWLRGYTPYFNDGDPCYHRSSVACGTYGGSYGWASDLVIKAMNDADGSYHEFLPFEDCIDVPFKEVLGIETGAATNPTHKRIAKILEKCLEIEWAYDTDFDILVTLKDGKLNVEQQHYNPEY